MYLDAFFFVHGPMVVVDDDESLSDHVLGSVFEYERVLYLFRFLVEAIDIKKIIRQGTLESVTTYLIGLNPLLKLTGINSDIRFGIGKSKDNSMHVQQGMNAFLPATKVLASEDLNF